MQENKPIQFHEAGQYKIIVQGKLSKSWADQFELTDYKEEHIGENNYRTSFVCHIKDQATLSGIINQLFDRHKTIISFIFIESDQESMQH